MSAWVRIALPAECRSSADCQRAQWFRKIRFLPTAASPLTSHEAIK